MLASERQWRRGQRRPLVVAHRGASAAAPENTMRAFRLAAELGADAIELDVMRCGSGEVVVFHDDDLRRLANDDAAVRTSPLHALRGFDIGEGERIPTLTELLADELLADLLINIELKAPERRGLEYVDSFRDDGLASSVAALLARDPRPARLLVSSFDPVLLGRFRAAAPNIATGLLFQAGGARPLREAWAAPLLRPTALHPEAPLVDARSAAKWRRHGYALHVWTVDHPGEINFLAALGVDAIITNRPADARVVLDRY